MIRKYVVDKYASLLGLPKEHTICVNLEKNTHNWAVNRSTSLGDTAAADNHRHMNRYKHKFLQIQYNLKKSPSLKDKIVNGVYKTSIVVELSQQALWPEGAYAMTIEESISKKMGT